MDTMQLGLIFNEDVEWTKNEENRLINKIDSFRSEEGYTYCDTLETKGNKIIVKLSYPRYFFGNNAYLVRSSKECFEVQNYFISQLKESKLFSDLEKIEVTRIDVPFTYQMEKGEKFSDYSNIFKVMGCVFIKNYPVVRPKAIIDLMSSEKETIIFTDSKTISGFNSKVTIYNQHLNLKNKLETYEFNEACTRFPDLKRRIRIEVIKRIKRNPFSLKKFKNYDFFTEYSQSYKEFLYKNIFNPDLLEEVYEEWAEILAKKLESEKDRKGKAFRYENFVLKELEHIFDYDILREAIKIVTPKEKTREKGNKTVRDALEEIEENGQKFIEVKDYMESICETIETSFNNQDDEDNDYPF